MNRLAKQLIIGGIYLLLIGGVSWFFYRQAFPAPTCSDGLKNGAEDGVDCGVVCGLLCPVAVEPLTQSDPVILKTGVSDYDVLVHLENANATYGASRVDYAISVVDAAGAQLASRRGSTYVNPSQSRYLVFPLVGLSTPPTKAIVTIDPQSVGWAKLTIDAAGDVQFAVRNDALTVASASVRFDGTVVNQSRFNFDTVDIAVLVYDAAGAIIGANTTVQRTVISGEQRAFRVDWPFALPGAVRAQAIVTTNVFINDNYLRTYGAPGSVPGI